MPCNIKQYCTFRIGQKYEPFKEIQNKLDFCWKKRKNWLNQSRNLWDILGLYLANTCIHVFGVSATPNDLRFPRLFKPFQVNHHWAGTTRFEETSKYHPRQHTRSCLRNHNWATGIQARSPSQQTGLRATFPGLPGPSHTPRFLTSTEKRGQARNNGWCLSRIC